MSTPHPHNITSPDHSALLSPPFFCGKGRCAYLGLYNDEFFGLMAVPLAACSEKDAKKFDNKRQIPHEGFPQTESALRQKPLAYREHLGLLLGLRKNYVEVRVFLTVASFREAFHALDAVDKNGKLVK